MAVIVLISDWRPPWCRAVGSDVSLLTAPLEHECVLHRLRRLVESVEPQAVYVAPHFAIDEAYIRTIAAVDSGVAVLGPRDIHARIWNAEPSDQLLLIDPRRVPVVEPDFRDLLREHVSDQGALTNLRLVPVAGDVAIEKLWHLDGGRVHAVRRLYRSVTGVEIAGVYATLVTIGGVFALGRRSDYEPDALRFAGWTAGLPTRDRLLSGPVADLTALDGVLAYCESRLRRPDRCSSAGAEVVALGANCRVHPSARLHGPLVLHPGVEVGPHACLVGPTVIGSNAVIGARALVTQSVVLPGAQVAVGRTVVREIVGHDANGAAGRAVAESAPGAFVRPTQHRPTPHWNAAAAWVDDPAGRGIGYETCKRVLDFIVASVFLCVLAPLFAVVAALIKLTSRGPVFFAHEREGRGGRSFCCWKFRTMVDRAHRHQRDLYGRNDVDGPQFKLAHDPRVTFVGQWLRRTNLDELPQLFNVLCGQMSLVGPRPSPFRENQLCVPWRRARLSVRPGITGLWQVCRHDRAHGDFHQWIYFDTLYVRHRSLLLDLRILLATVFTLSGRWAVPVSWLIPARQMNGRIENRHRRVSHRSDSSHTTVRGIAKLASTPVRA